MLGRQVRNEHRVADLYFVILKDFLKWFVLLERAFSCASFDI